MILQAIEITLAIGAFCVFAVLCASCVFVVALLVRCCFLDTAPPPSRFRR